MVLADMNMRQLHFWLMNVDRWTEADNADLAGHNGFHRWQAASTKYWSHRYIAGLAADEAQRELEVRDGS